jgi:hypothetical protein
VVAINSGGSSAAVTSAATAAVISGTNPILEIVLDMSQSFPLAA